MTTRVLHLEGLGLLGSLLAWRLETEGRAFTWHDTEQRVNAWTACTGAIYPSGDDFDRANYQAWKNWIEGEPLGRWRGLKAFYLPHGSCVETADYWFLSRNPPHGGRYSITAEAAGLHRAAEPSYHLNAQAFVCATREHFKAARLTASPVSPLCLIRAHGFGPRLSRFMWGWTAAATVKLSGEFPSSKRRACLYLRQGRFMLAYLYPIPGTRYHYIGSSLISQHKPRSLAIAPKLQRVIDHIHRATDFGVSITSVHSEVEGWRPVAAPADTELVRFIDNALCVRPLWHSGVRHAPALLDACMEALEGKGL